VQVKQQSGGQQVPWDASSLEGSFYFVPGNGTTAAAPPPAQPQPNTYAQPNAYSQPTTTAAPTMTRSSVSAELIESNFQSNLLDEVIKDGSNFLAGDPNNARVNLRVGQSYFRKNMYADAVPYLERAMVGGEPISLLVKRHRKSLGIYDALEDGVISVTASGLQMQFGGDAYTMPFAQIERIEAQQDPIRGMLIYLKGSVTNKKGKTENKDYKLFAPTAGIVQARDNAGNPIPVAVCNGCESWTAEVVKFINRSKAAK
jgi:hypothetical protein